MPETKLNRRALKFASFDEVRDELDRLASGRHVQLGKWCFAEICDHLATTTEWNLDGKPMAMPLLLRIVKPVVGPLVLQRILKSEAMAAGIGAPKEFAPRENPDQAASIARFKAVLARADAHGAPEIRNPFFGRMTNQQWRKLVLIHASHHLSFLVPE